MTKPDPGLDKFKQQVKEYFKPERAGLADEVQLCQVNYPNRIDGPIVSMRLELRDRVVAALRSTSVSPQAETGTEQSAEIESLRAQLASARKALEPFAKAADAFNGLNSSEHMKLDVTVGMLRAARAALAQRGPK